MLLKIRELLNFVKSDTSIFLEYLTCTCRGWEHWIKRNKIKLPRKTVGSKTVDNTFEHKKIWRSKSSEKT